MNRTEHIVAVLFAVNILPSLCQAGSDEPTQWLWGQRDTVTFQHSRGIETASSPQSARLKCAAEFCAAQFYVNDQPVGRCDETSAIQSFDVKQSMKPGPNSLRIQATATAGPAAVVYELHLVTEDGTKQIVRSSSHAIDTVAGDENCQSYGDVTQEPWWDVGQSPRVSVFDEYNQWQEPVGDAADGEAATFQIADGFQIEHVYRARASEGSWVSMALDDQGRILLGREDRGILRLTLRDGRSPAKAELINDTLQGVQGLLPTHDGLIVSANHSHGLYRLTPRSDDRDWDVALIRSTDGGRGDHGRHDVVRDAAGMIYVVHGDSIPIPDRFTSLVPASLEFQDGRPEDGHVIQTDASGTRWNVYCSGLRNPYGLAFNRDGELFTYDSDAERHTGLPWYRPTRILHLLPGVDYGWRDPGIPWPGYLPDTMLPIAKIGRGSPTSLKFGYASRFPAMYQESLLALDWSYGRILAVHLVPRGSTYVGVAEVLVRGRPFSVCDLEFDKDGSLLVITGGRDTQSNLYRIRYIGGPAVAPPKSRQMMDRAEYSADMRKHRRWLESQFEQRGSDIVDAAWSNLSHPDVAVRSAARILLEHQPPIDWQDRVWTEQRADVGLPALLALARVGDKHHFDQVHQRVLSWPLTKLSNLQLAVRIEMLIDQVLPLADARSKSICEYFEPSFPTGQQSVDRELCRLLVNHGSGVVVHRTLALISGDVDPIDKFHYLVCLADATEGWNADEYDQFFRLLNGAKLFMTDEGLDTRLQGLFDTVIRHVDADRQGEYRRLFANESDTSEPSPQLPFIQRWNAAEILRRLGESNVGRDPELGADVFVMAQCDRCHRFGTVGRAFGPDLTTVASRYSREHLVQQIVAPSKTVSSQYQNYTITLTDGRVLNGQVVYNGFRKSILRIATDPMALHETTEINKSQIESVQPSEISPMPERLLDVLTIEQIANLLAYLESDGT